MPDTISANAIAAGGVFEPQRVSNFLLDIPGVGGDGFQTSLSKFPFPKEATEPIKIPYMNEERKVAGRATYENYDLVVKDYVDKDIAKELLKWRRLVFDPATGKVGWTKAYKKQGTLTLFGPDGTKERKWKLVGVWPSSFNMGAGDMSGNAQVEITLALVVDYVVEE